MPKTKKQRKDEAAERQERHDALTRKQKIAKLAGRPGASNRELARLAASA